MHPEFHFLIIEMESSVKDNFAPSGGQNYTSVTEIVTKCLKTSDKKYKKAEANAWAIDHHWSPATLAKCVELFFASAATPMGRGCAVGLWRLDRRNKGQLVISCGMILQVGLRLGNLTVLDALDKSTAKKLCSMESSGLSVGSKPDPSDHLGLL